MYANTFSVVDIVSYWCCRRCLRLVGENLFVVDDVILT